jgi:hypothetical protein
MASIITLPRIVSRSNPARASSSLLRLWIFLLRRLGRTLCKKSRLLGMLAAKAAFMREATNSWNPRRNKMTYWSSYFLVV